MKISEKVLRYLKENHVDTIFGVPSGTVSPIVDSLNEVDGIDYILTKNEAGASYSACKYAKVGQKLGVVLLAGGVGVANAINGIAEATQAKAPLLVISGNVQRRQMDKGTIQDLDSLKLLREDRKGIVKYSKKVMDENDVLLELKKAIEIALEHPRGAVHVSIPVDVQRLEYNGLNVKKAKIKEIKSDFNKLDEAIKIINDCKNGILILGGGCNGFSKEIMDLGKKLNWRMVTTPSGKGVISSDYRLNLGNYGFASTDLANKYMESDNIECVVALGTRLGESATKNYYEGIVKDRKVIHIDIDKEELGKVYKEDVGVVADLKVALPYLTSKIHKKDIDNDIESSVNKPYINNHTGVSQRLVNEKITKLLPSDTFYLSDIGEFMNFSYKYLSISDESGFENNLNYGCMGNSIGALGVSKLFDKKRTIAVFMGDGSFWMNGLQETLTAKKYNMPIIYLVVNNAKLGYVDRGHVALFGRKIDAFESERIDITAVANAMGLKTLKVEKIEDLYELNSMTRNLSEPIVVEIINDTTEPIPLDRFKSLERQ